MGRRSLPRHAAASRRKGSTQPASARPPDRNDPENDHPQTRRSRLGRRSGLDGATDARQDERGRKAGFGRLSSRGPALSHRAVRVREQPARPLPLRPLQFAACDPPDRAGRSALPFPSLLRPDSFPHRWSDAPVVACHLWALVAAAAPPEGVSLLHFTTRRLQSLRPPRLPIRSRSVSCNPIACRRSSATMVERSARRSFANLRGRRTPADDVN